MKLVIEKKDLLNLLGKTQNIVEKRNTMPILINVLLVAKEKKLEVFATDLEVSLTDFASVQIEQEGKVAVNAKSLFDIVKELPEGSIHFSKKENNWLEIKQNKSVFNIVGISAEEYPVFPTYSTTDFTKVDPAMFKEMIEKTIFSVSNDETRYHMNGVYFEHYGSGATTTYRMVATDGYRLSLVDRTLDKKLAENVRSGVIIPRKGLNEIKKLLDTVTNNFEMAIEGSQLIVKTDSTVLMVRLIEGRYPNYQQFIPQTLQNHALVSREDLLASLKRVSLLSNQKSKGVTLALSNGKLEISSHNPELGDAKEELGIRYAGKDIKIGFNAKYILEVLNSFDDPEIDIELNDQLSPGLIRPHNDPSYTCVIMPMRI